MKNKLLYILAVGSALSLTSCEDYLSPESPSSFETEYVFSSTEDAYKMIMGAYAPFAQDPYTSRMSNVFLQNTDVEENSAPNAANQTAHRIGVWELNGGALEGWSDIKNAWSNSYLAIDRANQCIQGIKNSPLYLSGDADMKQMLGEAYCIRAYWYYLVCNYWGDVPFSEEPSSALNAGTSTRVSKDTIYSRCIQNLIDHQGGMKWAKDLNGGVERMSRDFALGLITRLSMFRAGYSMQANGTMVRPADYMDYYKIARDYADTLIQAKKHTLSPKFAEIFKDQCEYTVNNDGDMIYEVAFGKNQGGDVGWCIGLSVEGGTYGAGTSYITFPVSYYYSFDKKDTRRDATCSLVRYKTESKESVNGVVSIDPGKWCRLWLKESPGSSSSKSTGINWPVMRYSDVLLMYAEAENEINGGPTSGAIEALKQVRRRAFDATEHAEKVDNYVAANSSYDSFFNAIVNERAWEFGGECLRKFDLVRWNLYGEKIEEVTSTLYNMGKAAVGIDLENPEVAQYAALPDVRFYTLVKGTSAITGKECEVIQFKNDPFTKLEEDQYPTSTVSKYDDLKAGSGSFVKLNWLSGLMSAKEDDKGNSITDDLGNKIYDPCNLIRYGYKGYTGTDYVPGSGVAKSVVPYLLPIPYSITSASDGKLSNDGYGLVK
ncbi:putative outer membrane starch-binding protein [Breznakibacter xylanolyticus]|uniref:Putative outer membrane starch-binding protein n=1 Tax=Breznakibacter xylanolyticus TaxID=990 RepID=A0A2W7N0N7_9BACT|nr:RagB/SusD family nutrient uptake outer membrane protein [Breznakibacter xylanolyticus]PZX13688.1 putative outer membrane starch-binding protein [Breznakibacter xylanolyticus]